MLLGSLQRALGSRQRSHRVRQPLFGLGQHGGGFLARVPGDVPAAPRVVALGPRETDGLIGHGVLGHGLLGRSRRKALPRLLGRACG